VLRPALSDRMGRALFIGTPQGFNHFFDLFEQVQSEPDWAAFQFTTEQGGNVATEELKAAARLLDERTYRQEYQASFEGLGVGRVYHAFDRAKHVCELQYDPREPLIWTLDFNINPMCSVIAQQKDGRVHVLAELVLSDSNTLAACQEFWRQAESLAPNASNRMKPCLSSLISCLGCGSQQVRRSAG